MPPSHFHCHLVSAQGLGRVGPDTHRILREPPNGHLSSGATHVSALCARGSEQRWAASFPTTTSLSLWLMGLFLTEGHRKIPG